MPERVAWLTPAHHWEMFACSVCHLQRTWLSGCGSLWSGLHSLANLTLQRETGLTPLILCSGLTIPSEVPYVESDHWLG